MRELPEPEASFHTSDSGQWVEGNNGTDMFTRDQVIAIQKQAYEDGLRDAGKDAERYRWLRVCGDLDTVVKIVKEPGKWETPYPVFLESDELDSAIDAAMLTASQKEQK